jgi:hypothetical protein
MVMANVMLTKRTYQRQSGLDAKIFTFIPNRLCFSSYEHGDSVRDMSE